MAAPSTYAGLQTSVASWLNRDDLTDQIPEFISLAEAHFNRTLFTPDRETALSITADAQTEALPSDFWGFKTGPYVDGSRDNQLLSLTPGDLRDFYPDSTTGTPQHYAIEGTNILFGPVPSSSSIKGTYYARIPALSDSATTNWLLTAHPDLYLWGTLLEAFLFLRDAEGAALSQNRRDLCLADAANSGRMRRHNGPLTRSSRIPSIRNIRA